jgi:hypothetical protein
MRSHARAPLQECIVTVDMIICYLREILMLAVVRRSQWRVRVLEIVYATHSPFGSLQVTLITLRSIYFRIRPVRVVKDTNIQLPPYICATHVALF